MAKKIFIRLFKDYWLFLTLEVIPVADLFVTVDDERELELAPSEPIAESVVGSWSRAIFTGDFDADECELLGRRRDDVGKREAGDEDLVLGFVLFFRGG